MHRGVKGKGEAAMSNPLLVALLCLVTGDVTEPGPDRVVLANGREHEGVVVYEDGEQLVLRVNSRNREFEKKKVESVRATIRELPKALERIAALDLDKIDEVLALAKDLEGLNLPREARLLYWRVLTLDPSQEEANLALGHRKRQKSWVIPAEGRWYKLENLTDVRQDWGSAWEFETTHYKLRTNLPLAAALTIAIDLERFYFGFYAILGPGLRLHHVTEPMEVWIHADQASYPMGPRPGVYVSRDARLYVNAAGGFSRSTMIHEGTHELLDFTARRALPGKGKIPGWLDEGLAVYMQTCAGGPAGKLEVVPGGVARDRFAIHAGEKKPYRLNRVLNFQSDDFMASSKSHLKYAQAYTLVHFCLHAEDRRYEAAFFNFLRSAYTGKASSTHFKKAIGVKEKLLEEAWQEYVSSQSAGR